MLVLIDPKVLLVKKAIVDEKDPLVFSASMDSAVSEEKRAYKVKLQMF